MKAALIFFYSDNTLLVRKQSQCILQTSFEQGKEIEVKCSGCPYVALSPTDSRYVNWKFYLSLILM